MSHLLISCTIIYKLSIISTYFVSITAILHRSLSASARRFWRPGKIRKSGKFRFWKSQALAKTWTYFSDCRLYIYIYMPLMFLRDTLIPFILTYQTSPQKKGLFVYIIIYRDFVNTFFAGEVEYPNVPSGKNISG